MSVLIATARNDSMTTAIGQGASQPPQLQLTLKGFLCAEACAELADLAGIFSEELWWDGNIMLLVQRLDWTRVGRNGVAC